MNKKHESVEIAKITGDIMTLATMINELTNMCVFIDFSGHVNQFKIHITPSKKDYITRIVDDEIKTNSQWSTHEDTLKSLIRIKLGLKKTLREQKVDTYGLSYTVREEYDYHFANKSL